MKVSCTQNYIVEISQKDLVDFLNWKGYNAPDDTRFQVSGTDHNYNRITVGIGNGEHSDSMETIIATWVK